MRQILVVVETFVETAVMADIVAVADSRVADRAVTVDTVVVGLAPVDSPVADTVAMVDIVAVVDIQVADRAAARPDTVDIPVGQVDWDQMVDREDNPYKFYCAPDVLSIKFVYDRLIYAYKHHADNTRITPIIRFLSGALPV